MKDSWKLIWVILLLLTWGPTTSGDWGIPVNLGSPVNTRGNLELEPTVDPGDTILIYFYYPPVGNYHLRMSRKVSGFWSTPESLRTPFIPTAAEVPTSIMGIPEGIRFLFSSKRGGGQGGADIWYSDLINRQWSNPINLGVPINSVYNDNGFRIKGNGSRAYFTSQRPGSRGDHDIWVSDYVGGQWTEPVNLGDSINSGYSDQDPAVTEDEQELYFWRGGPGMQDPQIFTSRKVKNVWQGATRVGQPIHWRPYWGEDGPYFIPPGNKLYYSGGEDTNLLGGGDIWYVDRLVGVEEQEKGQGDMGARGQGIQLKVRNPAYHPLTISYILPDAGEARIDLYNGLGRWIKTIDERQRAAGRHELILTTDFAAGIYFVRLVTPKETLIQRITILR